MMDKIHLEKFREISVNEQKWSGQKLLDWWSDVFCDQQTRLKSTPVTREKLKCICANTKYSDTEVFAAVMAWGGMNRKHARRLKPDMKEICSVISGLGTGKTTKEEAYGAFFNLRSSLPKKLVGMGPAYYTKLIFFCSPKHDGYIMDQWTSKSVNLIFGKKIVDLYGEGYVSDKNCVRNYIEYCSAVETLAEMGGWSPEETEIRLFSEGRNKGEWRRYVKCRYVKANWH